jgi:uncharacterized protein (TIGR02246 family)
MTRPRSLLLAATAAFTASFAVSCSQQQPAAPPDTRAADAATIQAADADFAKAAAAKDLDRVTAPYLNDAVLFSPGTPAVIGKDNIRKSFERMLAAPNMQFVFSNVTVDVARSGDLAEDRGSMQVTVTDKKGKSTTQTGQYVLVWKKQANGSWKIAADTSANDK